MSLAERPASAGAWQNYRWAFEAYARQLREVQSLMQASEGMPSAQSAEHDVRIDQAVVELERARLAYSECRDALAAELSRGEQSRNLRPSAFPEVAVKVQSAGDDGSFRPEDSVRTVARRMWEMAGKPEGTAEEDWYRAERAIERVTVA